MLTRLLLLIVAGLQARKVPDQRTLDLPILGQRALQQSLGLAATEEAIGVDILVRNGAPAILCYKSWGVGGGGMR